jgi:hypothetical protein
MIFQKTSGGMLLALVLASLPVYTFADARGTGKGASASEVAKNLFIHAQPSNQSVTKPGKATFSVVVKGEKPVYAWYKNGAPIAAANAASYTTPATVDADHGAQYWVVISNKFGSITSTKATLSVWAAPSISSQPQDQTVAPPAGATFSVVASGQPTPTYQWLKNGVAIAGATSSHYLTGATSALDNNSRFSVRVSNRYGSVTSHSALLQVSSDPCDSLSYSQEVNRYWHTATRLSNGQILFAAGADGSRILTSAERYDPTTNRFVAAGSLLLRRTFPTSALLANGKVLISGGVDGTDVDHPELYDPATERFSHTSGMPSVNRGWFTSTVLADGKVLLAGGNNYQASADIYDPASDSFSLAAGHMTSNRHSHAAVRLQDGRVLLVGGNDFVNGYSTKAEIYDPATGHFTATGSLSVGRDWPQAILLANGKVLVVGGGSNTGNLDLAELYDPASGSFSPAGRMSLPRIYPAATLLPNGKVLVSGGWITDQGSTTTQEVFDPASNQFSPTVASCRGRYQSKLFVLPNGSVLNALGRDNSAEITLP